MTVRRSSHRQGMLGGTIAGVTPDTQARRSRVSHDYGSGVTVVLLAETSNQPERVEVRHHGQVVDSFRHMGGTAEAVAPIVRELLKAAGKEGEPRGRFDVPGLDLSEKDLRRGQDAYRDWHWGEEAGKVIDWQNPNMPSMLIECGRLVRMHMRAPSEGGRSRHPRRQRDTMIELSQSISANSHIAYDPDHPFERLYLLVAPKARKTLKKIFWDENDEAQVKDLNDVAVIAGGKHGRRDYAPVPVKTIGVLTAIVYFTTKRGDGASYYIHQVGELSAFYPFLCCDRTGQLWLAGGNTTSPTPGITD